MGLGSPEGAQEARRCLVQNKGHLGRLKGIFKLPGLSRGIWPTPPSGGSYRSTATGPLIERSWRPPCLGRAALHVHNVGTHFGGAHRRLLDVPGNHPHSHTLLLYSCRDRYRQNSPIKGGKIGRRSGVDFGRRLTLNDRPFAETFIIIKGKGGTRTRS